MNENCATCHHDYEVTPQNGGIVLFLDYERANHVLASCPNCKAVEVIYLRSAAVVELLSRAQFPLVVQDKPTAERREAADSCWGRFESVHAQDERRKAWDELPEAPREWVRQLHDDLRSWGRTPRQGRRTVGQTAHGAG
ncbi:hypothetical protein [Pedococcus sp. 5OH_020]|uniref:hypothetical protein n=1 Tax=Pedococcus sp. 5OH_020 TaxID=2989814 RepID=UPI0022E9B26F|nr:hypothetical protein [Pedococcus sp. 5OH_020]